MSGPTQDGGPSAEILARNLRAILDERQESPLAASLAAGLSRTAIDDFLRGRSKSVRLDTVDRIAAYFEIPTEILLDPRGPDEIRAEIAELLESVSEEERRKVLRMLRAFTQKD